MVQTDEREPRRAYFTREEMPREIASGVFWLGGCSDTGAWGGEWAESNDRRHVYTNAYLVVGSERTLLVESGHSAHWDGVTRDLDRILGDRALDFVFPSHQEIPHCGNLPRLAARYPELVVVGDVREYPLYYPSVPEDRLHQTDAGSSIDLGGVTLEFLSPIWHDLPGTLWLMAHGPDVLFCVDGLQFSHEHWAGDCGKLSDELAGPPRKALIEAPTRDTLKWAAYSDMVGLAADFEQLLASQRPRLLGPSHGAPILTADIDLISIIMDTIDAMSRSDGAAPA